jgi:hypothetical protein
MKVRLLVCLALLAAVSMVDAIEVTLGNPPETFPPVQAAAGA